MALPPARLLPMFWASIDTELWVKMGGLWSAMHKQGQLEQPHRMLPYAQMAAVLSSAQKFTASSMTAVLYEYP